MKLSKKALLAIPLATVLCMVLLAYPFGDSAMLGLVYAADEHANDIQFVEVWQDDGGLVLRHNLTSSGGTHRISDGQVTNFVVSVKFNTTLAEDEAQAVEYTRVYMNISTVWTDQLLNNTAVTMVGDFYVLTFVGNWTTSLPVAGETYECSVLYQGYY